MMTAFRMTTIVVVVMMMMMLTEGGVVSSSASSTAKTSIVSQQQSLSTALRDLQKYQQEQNGPDQAILSCLITSRSVTAKQRKQVMDDILQINQEDVDGDTGSFDDTKKQLYQAIATSDGMVFLQPSTVMEAVQLVSSANRNNHDSHLIHRVLYYPDPIDLQRGEGLTDTLGPVLESLLQQPSPSSTTPLVQVLIPNGMESSVVQTQIEASIQQLLPYWIINTGAPNTDPTHVRDWIRSKISYTLPQAVMDTPLHSDDAAILSSSTSSSELLLRLRTSSVGSRSTGSSPNTFDRMMTSQPQQWTASNRLRPVAQQQYQNIVSALQTTCFTNSDTATTTLTESTNSQKTADATKFVPNFGELCDAIVTKEMAFWYDNSNTKGIDSAVVSSRKSIIGRQICEKLYEDIFMYVFSNIYTEQINKLQKICYDTLKKDLSKLVISPNLPTDMNRIGQSSISTFVTDTVRLIPKTSFVSRHHTSFLTSYAVSVQRMYVRKVQEYIQNRILMAQASGTFRPVPRKGITIGMHYLLPKPFGNDYRQEPSMIHATDQMVYIPKTAKLSDVSPEQISSGSGSDWKNSIVPHPPGNDMLYMQ